MYDVYFDFDRKPFAPIAEPEFYFPAAVVDEARETLHRCLRRGEGAAMVVGSSGVGKTTLLHTLAAELADDFQTVLLSGGRLGSRRALLQAILHGLSRPYRGIDEGELRLSLIDHLVEGDDLRPVVLLVDEAHTLSLRLLDELRMLTNTARDGQMQLRLATAGACILEEHFAHPKLDSFNQRTVARCYLESFTRCETRDYVLARLARAGASAEALFSEEACRSVYQATDGIPRLINQVCDQALMLVYVGGRRTVESHDVEEAWADLQQLPTPQSDGCSASADDGGSVVEFGGLEDDLNSNLDSDLDGDLADATEAIHGELDELEVKPLEEETPRATLRISQAEESLGDEESTTDDPTASIGRIEDLVADAEEEFRPAGTIGPEIELRFVDPFDEPFEEEEVVGDRYTSDDAATGEPAPVAAQPSPGVNADSAEPLTFAPEPSPDVQNVDAPSPLVENESVEDERPEEEPVAVAAAPRAYDRLFASLRQG